jgi:hypothetical protein
MNDKLLEFAIQSGVVESNVDWEKFAELIAKEILNISDEVITLSDSPEWLICERLGINHDWRRQYNFWS